MGTSAPKPITLDGGLEIRPKHVSTWAGTTDQSFPAHRTGFKNAERWRDKLKVKKDPSEAEKEDLAMLTLLLKDDVMSADCDQDELSEAVRNVVFKEKWSSFKERAKLNGA